MNPISQIVIRDNGIKWLSAAWHFDAVREPIVDLKWELGAGETVACSARGWEGVSRALRAVADEVDRAVAAGVVVGAEAQR